MSRAVIAWPSFAGGVCGKARLKAPSTRDAAAATWNIPALFPKPRMSIAYAGDDPADRAEHANARELLSRVGHLVERQRVGQRQRRHVAQRVDEQHRVESAERRQRRDVEQQERADQMERGENPLGCEEPIGDHADEEGRDHRRQRGRSVGEADLRAVELQRLVQVGAHRDVPGPPDEILEEHHHRQLQSRCRRHLASLNGRTKVRPYCSLGQAVGRDFSRAGR